MPKICLFPIPNSVTFPGTVFPLHVFEPRYRNMIKYCIGNKMPIAICHTQKMVSPSKGEQSIEQALQTNQATYKPYTIFSAGECELLTVAEDGRMYLNIHITQRYKSIKEIQTLPFLIHECELFEDRDESEDELAHASQLQKVILLRLLELTKDEPEVHQALSSEQWQNKPLKEFSFELFSLIVFEPEIQQYVLSMDSSLDRLQYTLDLLVSLE